MKITPITNENLEHFEKFISKEDAQFIKEGSAIIPIGLVADDVEEGKNLAAGAICCRPDDFILDITSFWIAPSYRGRGAGKFLLDETKRLFMKEDMEFNTEFMIVDKEQEDFVDFLEEYGFNYIDPEYDIYSIKVKDLDETKISGKEGSGKVFSSIDKKMIEEAQKFADKKGLNTPMNGFNSESVDKDISVLLSTNDKVEGFVAFEKLADDRLLLSAVWAEMPVTVLHILEKAVNLVKAKYSPETTILIQSVDDTTDDLLDNLFGDNISEVTCRFRYPVTE